MKKFVLFFISIIILTSITACDPKLDPKLNTDMLYKVYNSKEKDEFLEESLKLKNDNNFTSISFACLHLTSEYERLYENRNKHPKFYPEKDIKYLYDIYQSDPIKYDFLEKIASFNKITDEPLEEYMIYNIRDSILDACDYYLGKK